MVPNGTNGAILNKWYHHIDMELYLPHTVIAIKLTIKKSLRRRGDYFLRLIIGQPAGSYMFQTNQLNKIKYILETGT